MEFATVIGIVGSVASLVGLFLPAQTNRQRATHAIYGLSIAIVASFAIFYQQKWSQTKQIEQAAIELVTDRRMNFTDAGFVQASLAFLEAHKDVYPDAYARAQEICKMHHCLESKYGNDGHDSLNRGYDEIETASAMEGLIRGIAALNKGR